MADAYCVGFLVRLAAYHTNRVQVPYVPTVGNISRQTVRHREVRCGGSECKILYKAKANLGWREGGMTVLKSGKSNDR